MIEIWLSQFQVFFSSVTSEFFSVKWGIKSGNSKLFFSLPLHVHPVMGTGRRCLELGWWLASCVINPPLHHPLRYLLCPPALQPPSPTHFLPGIPSTQPRKLFRDHWLLSSNIPVPWLYWCLTMLLGTVFMIIFPGPKKETNEVLQALVFPNIYLSSGSGRGGGWWGG